MNGKADIKMPVITEVNNGISLLCSNVYLWLKLALDEFQQLEVAKPIRDLGEFVELNRFL